jgi:hypothetical protein
VSVEDRGHQLARSIDVGVGVGLIVIWQAHGVVQAPAPQRNEQVHPLVAAGGRAAQIPLDQPRNPSWPFEAWIAVISRRRTASVNNIHRHVPVDSGKPRIGEGDGCE